MRKLSFTLLAAIVLAAFTFTSCDKDENPTPDYELRIIGFENAELPSKGYLLNEEYTESGMTFDQYYEWFEEYGGYYSWNGFTVSNNHDKTTAGYTNEFSVYGNGGYDGGQFAVAYYAAYINTPVKCSFAQGAEYEVEYVYVTNSTYAYLSILNGDNFAKAFSTDDKDWFKLTITGYKADGKETKAVDVYLADYRNAATPFIMSEWTKVDLTSLGAVNRLEFTFTSTDNDPVNGIKTPAYACIDNITYREYVTK